VTSMPRPRLLQASPNGPDHLPDVPCPFTPADRNRCPCRLLPRSASLPHFPGTSASVMSLSRPAQASLALRPEVSLPHHAWALSQGFGPPGYPDEPLDSYEIKPMTIWVDPSPLVICAVGAH
jgi:hypothetical protein